MKKTLIALLTLLMVGLMGFATLGSIGFCTETDGDDAWCFGDSDYLYFGTDRDAKMAWVTDSVVMTTDFDIVGAVDITGALTFSGALAVTGNFTADGTVMSIDGSTSVDFLSAGHVDIESGDIRLGLDATHYMKLVTVTSSGNLTITHPGKTPAVSWTATSFDFGGTFAADALTLSDSLTFSDAATIDNSNSTTLALTEDTIDLVGATLADALTLSDVLTFSGAGTIDNTTTDILMLTEATVGVTGIFDVTGNLTQDGSAVSIDGDTTFDLLGATRIDVYSPLIYLGRDADDYMLLTTTDSSGNLDITHQGTPAVTWAANSFAFTGTFDVNGASTFDAITGVGNLSIDGTTALIDGATSVRAVSAGFNSLEGPANRFGSDASWYMQIATTATSGNTAITHTGGTPAVTWAADSLTFTGAFEVAGASTFEAITGVGNFSIDATTALVDGATSVRLVSAGFASLEGPATRIGVDDTFYTNFAVATTTGNLTITHVGGSTDLVTWTAAGGFDFVGAMAADAVTVSDVLTFSDAGTIDNTNATTLTLTETTIDLVGATLADALTLSDVLTFSDGGTVDNSDATTLQLTETNIDLVGACAADALTLSDVLTFSDGGTMDNTAADTLTITEDNIVLTGAVGVVVTETGPFTVGPDPVVLVHRHRVTVGELIAGPHEMMPAVAGMGYRIVDVTVIAYGGAMGTTTTIDILGDRSGSIKLFTYATAQLTRSAVLNTSDTGVVVLADGTSFTVCDDATAITASFTGGNPDTATGVDFIITYVLET